MSTELILLALVCIVGVPAGLGLGVLSIFAVLCSAQHSEMLRRGSFYDEYDQ